MDEEDLRLLRELIQEEIRAALAQAILDDRRLTFKGQKLAQQTYDTPLQRIRERGKQEPVKEIDFDTLKKLGGLKK